MANEWQQDDNEQRDAPHRHERNENDNNFRIKFRYNMYIVHIYVYNNNRFFRKFGYGLLMLNDCE